MNYKALYFVCFLIFLIFIASVVTYHFFVQIPQDKKDAENQKLMDAALAEIDAENAKQAEIENKREIQQYGVDNCILIANVDYFEEWYGVCSANLKDSRVSLQKDEDGNINCIIPMIWADPLNNKLKEQENYCKTKSWQEWDYEVNQDKVELANQLRAINEKMNKLKK